MRAAYVRERTELVKLATFDPESERQARQAHHAFRYLADGQLSPEEAGAGSGEGQPTS